MADLFTISSSELTVSVSAFGAELWSIRDRDGTEYLWQGDPKYWSDRAPTLFPYVARLWEKSYFLDGKRYSMDIHGFAPYSPFALREHNEDSLTLELIDSEQTWAMYPRAFSFRVCFTLNDRTLTVRYEIENRDEKPLFCGLGGHPGFRVPLRDGERFSDYRLLFEQPQDPVRVGFTPDCFVNGMETPFPMQNGNTLPLHHAMFDDDAIVLRRTGHAVRLLDAEGKTRLRVAYPDMDWLGLWHMPHTDAPYLCIEPWCSLPSRHGVIADLSTQPDLIRCEPGETQTRTWSVTLF